MLNGRSITFILFALILLPLVFPSEERQVAIQNIRERTLIPADFLHLGDLYRSSRLHEGTYDLAAVLERTFLEFEQLFANIIHFVETNVPKISQDTEILLSRLSNCTRDVLYVFSNTAQDVSDAVLSEMFVIIERQLEEVNVEFHNVADSVDQRFEWAVHQLNETLMNNTAEYNWWTAHIKQKLRYVNDTELYKDGCRSIDEFMHRSTQELKKCCKVTMKPMRTLCKDVTSLLTEAMHVIVDAMDRIQECLEDKHSYMEYLVPCINLAYDDITSVISRASQIKHMINNMLPMKIIYTRSCFAIVMVDMKHRRNAIEANLFQKYRSI